MFRAISGLGLPPTSSDASATGGFLEPYLPYLPQANPHASSPLSALFALRSMPRGTCQLCLPTVGPYVSTSAATAPPSIGWAGDGKDVCESCGTSIKKPTFYLSFLLGSRSTSVLHYSFFRTAYIGTWFESAHWLRA